MDFDVEVDRVDELDCPTVVVTSITVLEALPDLVVVETNVVAEPDNIVESEEVMPLELGEFELDDDDRDEEEDDEDEDVDFDDDDEDDDDDDDDDLIEAWDEPETAPLT